MEAKLIQKYMGNTYINDLCKVKFYQMLPVTVAHHVKIINISVLIVINIQIIREYYVIVLISYLQISILT